MTFTVCHACDGSGNRDLFSGAPCYECNGTGLIEDRDPDDDEDDDDYLDTIEIGEVP